MPNLVFAGAAQELERDATDLMDRLTDGRYRLEMRTEKVNKGDGETVETLEIVVVADSGKERPFARLSGGEKFRVTLVLHTSLTRFLVRRSGAPIEFLGVDEGWGSLDPEGIVAMLDALRMLHDEFPLDPDDYPHARSRRGVRMSIRSRKRHRRHVRRHSCVLVTSIICTR